MPKPRKALINLAATSYYHCISRCVRRAYLCGKDKLTGQCYEHRRQWVEERILFLAQYFAIDICAFAVMSNHIHLVLSVESDRCDSWTDKEVLYRWHQIYKGEDVTQRYLKGEGLTIFELNAVSDYAVKYRERLRDISWFMRSLNEPIARKANTEDECTGRFWEGRFKSQPLLDEAAILSCMAYVDLNPVRAKIAKNLEESDHTSIKMHIKAAMQGKQPEILKPFQGHIKDSEISRPLMFSLQDYLELVDATGRIIRHDKKGSIPEHEAKLLNKLNISAKKWVHLTQNFETIFKTAVGQTESLTSFYQAQNYKKRVGISASKTYLKAS